jgi:osmotically-inducible protein OsmY
MTRPQEADARSRWIHRHPWFRFVPTLAVLVLAGSVAGRALAEPIPDDWITLKTKIALVTEGHLPVEGLHVDTANGWITLYGRIGSEAERTKAGAVAQAIKGNNGVRNLLQVVPPASEPAVAEADDHLRQAVAAALKRDTSLAASNLSVKAVDKGSVLLSGTANTLFDQWRAVELARSVPGVRNVATEIRSPDEIMASESSTAGKDNTSAMRDSWTTADVKLRLLADAKVPALAISVDTLRGVVSLFGTVQSAAAKAAAVTDARNVEWVNDVHDDLLVADVAAPQAADVPDHVLKRNIQETLKAYPELRHCAVQVEGGRAHLTGSVASARERLRAVTAARAVTGVRSVDDRLHIQATAK